jgi:hypothetical protein
MPQASSTMDREVETDGRSGSEGRRGAAHGERGTMERSDFRATCGPLGRDAGCW